MSKKLQNFIAQYKPEVEEALLNNIPLSHQPYAENLNRALQYAIFPGGKRWRPMLTILGGLLVGAPIRSLLTVGCAIEYLHASSIILDDMPAMDDAYTRRGKLALHLAFDESTALLTALALMNHSYALLAEACNQSDNNESAGRLITLATSCLGTDGMIGGQAVDLQVRGACLGLDTLLSRNLKTTALTQLMMTSGAIAVGAACNEVPVLAQFGEALGLAYQIHDDLLDEVGEVAIAGKTVKQDSRHLRASFVSEYGLAGAQKMADEIIETGLEILRHHFGNTPEVALLSEAIAMIINSKQIYLQNHFQEVVAAS